MKTLFTLMMLTTIAIASAASATPLPKEHQAVLYQMVRDSCIRSITETPEHKEYVKNTGRDISKPYCECVADKAMKGTRLEDVQAEKPPASLTAAHQSYAKECMQEMQKKFPEKK